MKTTKLVILTGITMLLCVAGLRAQVKIGDDPLEIRDNRLLELQSGLGDGVGEFFFIKDYNLTDSTGMTIGRASNNNDPLMIKLFGYGQGPSIFQAGAPGIGSRSHFLGTNANGEMLEFPMSLDLLSDGTLSLNDGDVTFGSVQLDTVFASNTQLLDSINNVRVLVQNSNDADRDTNPTNELIDRVHFDLQEGSDPPLTLVIEDPGGRYPVELDLGLASDEQLKDTTQVLRDLNFYLKDNTFDDATRTASGGGVTNLTFDALSAFNVTNTEDISLSATTGNVNVSSNDADVVISGNGTSGIVDVDANAIDIDGESTVDITSNTGSTTIQSNDADVVISGNGTSGTVDVDANAIDIDGAATVDITAGTGNATFESTSGDVIVNASGNTIDMNSDSVLLQNELKLEGFAGGAKDASYNRILGIDADGNVVSLESSSVLGTEADSTIYTHNGSLTAQRFMTMDGNDLHFVGGTSTGDTTVIHENGTISIGRTTVRQGTTTDVKLDVEGDIFARRVHSSSDKRFKKDINVIENALAMVQQIDGVTWQWRQDEFPERGFSDEQQVGFIAQNIEKVLPQVVMTADDGYKAVDYAKVTALLTEAIKEQQRLIEEQNAIITAQSDKISRHGSDMSTLASAIESLRAELNQLKLPSSQSADE